MGWITDVPPRDEAADASQFLSRLGYVLLGLAAPAGVVLHPLAIFLLFPIGVALIVFAALLDPPNHSFERITAAIKSPIVNVCLALFAWSALSLLWTPFPVEGGQRLAEFVGWAVAVALALSLTREHARATDLYLFPFGLVLTMAAILIAWIGSRQGAPIDFDRIEQGGSALAVLLFPAMGGLAARARNGFARSLMILAFIYAFAIGSTPTMIALFAGLAALSFALSDLERTTRDLGWIAALLIALAPLVVLVAEPLARLMMHAKLQTLPAPYPSLGFAFTVVMHDWARLVTGHGIETVAGAIRLGALPPETPRTALFQIWYELGVVGAWLAAAGVWFGFRAIGEFPPRLAPYLTAALACVLMLATTRVDFDDTTWVMTLAVSLIAADVAARSQYRTTRPSAERLAHF